MSSPSIPVRMSYTPIHAHHTRSIGSDSQGANAIAILNARVNDLWEFVGNYLSIQKRTSISPGVGLVILVDIPTSTTLRAGNMPQLWQMTWLGQRIHCSGLWMTVSTGVLIREKPWPWWPFCAPGFLPDFLRRLEGFGLANPLENGCFELLREFLLDRSFNLAFSRRKTSTCSRNSEISLKGKDNFFRRYN